MQLSDRSTSPLAIAAALAALLAGGMAAAYLGGLLAQASMPSSTQQLEKPKVALATRPGPSPATRPAPARTG